ncbi:MAG: sulfite exporter TauE/SafE family protein [Phycisphaerales bacterium]|nr:sulfite exporter TauE/SafE family protein [Phycisphaerales bacterium]
MLETLPIQTVIVLATAILALAVLYSSVGHAGASGYLAAMALITQFPQEQMKAVALTLNIFVGIIGAWRFIRAGHFDWNTFWPFGLIAIPMAFVGGLWSLPPMVFKPLIGGVLLFAAVILTLKSIGRFATHEQPVGMPRTWIALVAGAILGLLAGLTGTGGGIFLSPLLILMGWAGSKRTAAVSVVFVLVNSIAGLGGVVADAPNMPDGLPIYIAAAITGGLIGSRLGARHMSGNGIRLLLATVLLLASVKMFFTLA